MPGIEGGLLATEAAGMLADDLAILAQLDPLGIGAELEQALTGTGFANAVITAFRATNLLSPDEKPRVEAALKSAHADAFIQGAAKLTVGDAGSDAEGPSAARCVQVDSSHLPAVSVAPAEHLFLKPMVTTNFAARVGHTFSEIYRPQLDAEVYASPLDMARATKSEIAQLNPADNIDIQSFIWVVGE